jgi:diaminobutyrate-2-oxoglutarate transaminase
VPIFEGIESEVRSYCRRWPVVFERASGSYLYSEDGRGYLDFFAGAGALNYGHNNAVAKQALLEYISCDGVAHSLDMYTTSKRRMLETLTELILAPRKLSYRVQFTGPTGASAMEAALRLARKFTGRRTVVSFAAAFHGMTAGARSISDERLREATGPTDPRAALQLPFCSEGEQPDLSLVDSVLLATEVAAVIVETVQGEGGVRPADQAWLRGLSEVCQARGGLLIIDDVQMGCGRTGPFFSFEGYGLQPDIICLSKSISGFGLPLALLFVRPEIDVWRPGEHSGTFRGNNHAFVTAAATLRAYWSDGALETHTGEAGRRLASELDSLSAEFSEFGVTYRDRGLIGGLAFPSSDLASKVCGVSFEQGLLLETAGRHGEVVKLIPPLTISGSDLDAGVQVLRDAVRTVLS